MFLFFFSDYNVFLQKKKKNVFIPRFFYLYFFFFFFATQSQHEIFCPLKDRNSRDSRLLFSLQKKNRTSGTLIVHYVNAGFIFFNENTVYSILQFSC